MDTSSLSLPMTLFHCSPVSTQTMATTGKTLTLPSDTTDVVTLAVGQRTDVVFTASGKPTDAVWMRSTLGTSAFFGGCTLTDGISPEAVAAIYYQNANTSVIPTTNSSVSATAINTCLNDPLSSTIPAFPIAPPLKPQTQEIINITYQSNGTNDLFYMNNSTFRADYNDALLLEAKMGYTKFPEEWNVYNFGSSQSIRLVVYNYAQTGAHPMHMHGHNMYVLDFGTGMWDGTITRSSNPQRRDVQLLPNAVSATDPGYLVLQIDANNPGVWPFHCHIAWHVSAGLYINIIERPDKIKYMQIPDSQAQTCREWGSWTGNHIPDQIDSGL
jgi:FtsP/CotA-like multicopper oxidase with cupredoxin domain